MRLVANSKALLGMLTLLLATSCGSSDSDKGRNSKGPEENRNSQDSGSGSNEVQLDGYYPEYITDQAGNRVPISKLPSMIHDDEWFDVCSKGQIPFLDHCFDEISITDKAPGFRLISKSRTFEAFDTLNAEWQASLQQLIPPENGYSTSEALFQKITYGGGEEYIEVPSIVASYNFVTWYKSKWYFKVLEIHTRFAFGGRPQATSPHLWYINGEIELNGTKIKLPATRKQIAQAIGRSDGERLYFDGMVINFRYNSTLPSVLGEEGYSPNPDEQWLTTVRFEMDSPEERFGQEDDDVQPDSD